MQKVTYSTLTDDGRFYHVLNVFNVFLIFSSNIFTSMYKI